MNKGLVLMSGVGFGAGFMYVFDPDRGKRRRALILDQAVRAANTTSEAMRIVSRDASNRTRGVVASMQSCLSRGFVTLLSRGLTNWELSRLIGIGSGANWKLWGRGRPDGREQGKQDRAAEHDRERDVALGPEPGGAARSRSEILQAFTCRGHDGRDRSSQRNQAASKNRTGADVADVRAPELSRPHL